MQETNPNVLPSGSKYLVATQNLLGFYPQSAMPEQDLLHFY